MDQCKIEFFKTVEDSIIPQLQTICEGWIDIFGCEKLFNIQVESLVHRLEKMFNGIVKKNRKTQAKLKSRIESLMNEKQRIESLLNEEIKPPIDQSFSLNDRHKNLKTTIISYREKCIRKFQQEAKELAEKLEIDCSNVKKLLEDDLQLTAANVDKLEEIVVDWRERKILYQEIENVRSQIEIIWKDLEVSDEVQSEFDSLPLNNESLDKLQAELQRCNQLKLEKFPKLVDQLIQEIFEYSEKCKKPVPLRMHPEDYDQSNLIELEANLKDLKVFYEENEKVLTLLDKRDNLKTELEALKVKQQDLRSRLQNRGGQLLKDEQERKLLEKKLQKAEIALSKAAAEYQSIHNTPFTVNGELLKLEKLNVRRKSIKKPYNG
ncbi:CLUMA_CG012940, isoform A [Clunio marinus]|uniref:CLUMA_CG012940, isoform A n=1 Tax=Clunio marinus TaxID=568069 RepID=A0A1J1IJA7_9DIPT|nr:CLUMA_CG012940, isoform A [Clunio marinus]